MAERPPVSDYVGVGLILTATVAALLLITFAALAYIVWNRLAYRFALFAASTIVLSVLWGRFALQSWPG